MTLAQVKLNPTRLRLPKYGNALMLLMEDMAKSNTKINKVHDLDEFFDVEIHASKNVAQSIKNYINRNI
tara:strand:+ start:150 stop:356 length:207 start_codon:yes stop_codon:yes gene_type:complete